MADPTTQSHADWLADTFTRNRALFGGWSMEIDPATPPGGDPATPPAPTPTPPAPTPPTPTPGDPGDDGKGGKDAILADLAKERDKRQALEAQVQDLLPLRDQFAAIAKVFSPGDDTPPDPAKLAEQITASQAETATEKTARLAAERQLAVFKAAPAAEGNAAALLDSASFLAAIKDVDPTDSAALDTAIKQAIEANPLFKANPAAPVPSFHGGPRTPAAPQRAGTLGAAIADRVAGTNR